MYCFLWPQPSLPGSCGSTDGGHRNCWSSVLYPRLHNSAARLEKRWGKIFGGVGRRSLNTWGHSPPGNLWVCTILSKASSSIQDPGGPKYLDCNFPQSFPYTPTGRGGGGEIQTPHYWRTEISVQPESCPQEWVWWRWHLCPCRHRRTSRWRPSGTHLSWYGARISRYCCWSAEAGTNQPPERGRGGPAQVVEEEASQPPKNLFAKSPVLQIYQNYLQPKNLPLSEKFTAVSINRKIFSSF